MKTTIPAADLPRIVRFEGATDAGEFGAATCPHCGALGRYVFTFTCEDGTRRGAMSGCIQKFPVSKLAEEHRKIMERQRDRERTGQNLASWDTAKLVAIDAVAAGTMTIDAALAVVQTENRRRSQWMDRRHGRR